MSEGTQPSIGSVVWAELDDGNGNVKKRPAVVIEIREVDSALFAHVVAVTTQLPEPLPENYVPLPWSRQATPKSGLRKKCAAVADWQQSIPIENVIEVVGIVSDVILIQILEKMVGE